MAVISVSIEKSKEEIIFGIPKSIVLTTNIPSTIFYTLDGSIPDTFSEIYTSKIFLPRDKSYINLKILATNGVSFSPILSEEYFTNLIDKNIRNFGSGTTADVNQDNLAIFPFGSNSSQPEVIFNASVSDHQAITDETAVNSNAYNADGYRVNFTKLPYTTENYQIKYDQMNSRGQRYRGVGTAPLQSNILLEKEPPEETLQFSKTFDPRAMVIFQDVENEDSNDPPQINKKMFVLDKVERTKDGSQFFIAGNEVPMLTGSFVRQHYNPRTNKMTYYYFDSQNLKWIISSQDYSPAVQPDTNYSGTFLSRGPGVGKVFKWIPYFRRHLF